MLERRALLSKEAKCLGVSAMLSTIDLIASGGRRGGPSSELTDSDALDLIVEVRGNLNRAAEIAGVDKTRIIDGVANNLPQLKRRTQATVLIELLSLADKLQGAFTSALNDLDPEHAVKAYLDVMKLTVAVSEDRTLTQNINHNEFVFGQLDRGLQQAFIAAAMKADSVGAGVNSDKVAGEVYDPEAA